MGVRPIEALEARMAPGGMLDLLGFVALSSAAPALVERAERPRAETIAEATSGRRSEATELRATFRGVEIRESRDSDPPAARAQARSIPQSAIADAAFDRVGQELAGALTEKLRGLLEIVPSGARPGRASIETPVANPAPVGESVVLTAPMAAAWAGTRMPSGAPIGVPVSSIGGDGLEAPQTVSAETPIAAEGSSAPQSDAAGAEAEAIAESRPVPRGLPYANQADREQSLEPYAITYDGLQSRQPASGIVRSPAEFDPMRGVLFSYASFQSVVTDMVKELTEDPSKDDMAYVVVSSTAQRTAATNSFTNAGADLSKVQFFIQPTDSVWIRDYGPHFISVDESLAIVDSHYYPNRPQDNFIPTLLGDNNFQVPTYDMGLYYSGGNFQPGPNRSGFATSLVTYHNTLNDGFNESFISELYHKYQGIDTLHILPQLPFSVDATGHIDMWLYLVDEDTVVISEFKPGSNATAIQITTNAVDYMENLGFEVLRTPAWNSGATHYTYANAFRVNDRIFVPVYGTAVKPGGNASYNDEDAAAMAVWQAAAGPGVEVIPIQCNGIIPSAGAIHCIVKQVPRHTASAPAASLLSPAGGEILTAQSPFKIEWTAIDTNNVEPAEIRLYVSYDNGDFEPIATTSDTGSYNWTPPRRAADARIKIVAKSGDGDEVEVVSNPFAISGGEVSIYDFSSGAGVDKFGYGSQTSSWAAIQGNALPVGSAFTAGQYTAMSTSNATGGDTDANRYIAPVPSPTSNESTHVFRFQLSEPIGSIAQIDALWEGYADFCTQVELYVWDRVAQNWGDASGLTGNNRYLDSWAGNADGTLSGSIRGDFSRYVDPSGEIRFLVYADRTGTNPDTQHNAGQGLETFHDYLSVSVKQVDLKATDPPVGDTGADRPEES